MLYGICASDTTLLDPKETELAIVCTLSSFGLQRVVEGQLNPHRSAAKCLGIPQQQVDAAEAIAARARSFLVNAKL